MATNLSALEAAMVEATASRAPVERKLTTAKAEYAAARAELTARAKAGKTVMLRNRLGRFIGAVKVSTTETVRYGYGNEPSKPAEITLYASEGFDGATMLHVDVERTRWVMTAKERRAEGDLIKTWDSRPNVRVTWAVADALKKAA